ncbi:RNA polymerase sigma factor SigJ [Azospirillum doebereinerae]|uniref:RNA polymerase sigma factor SigJ n=1 Tax=Azospirillum doebereinerae TaxID=92933 RepID=UPI001EE4F0F9|nr:RNA polymerase sigma factor SigJ [Azospirillum doebereinerae]
MTAFADTTQRDPLAVFAAERGRLRALAYRLLGSVAEAEDVLQDAWLRWSAVDAASVDSAAAFLTTVVTRLALDRLRSARAVRERYYGLWLPEPEVSPWDEEEDPSGSAPMAMMLLLERLAPDQRAVFVLREAMDLDYAEIAAILGKSAEACRQIMRRARSRLSEPSTTSAAPEAGRKLAAAFAEASVRRDYAGIVALLSDDALWLSDGGGYTLTALNPIRGPDRIARFIIGVQRKKNTRFDFDPVRVNGGPGFLVRFAGAFMGVWALDIADGRVTRLYKIANPHKLTHVAPPAEGQA